MAINKKPELFRSYFISFWAGLVAATSIMVSLNQKPNYKILVISIIGLFFLG